MADKKIIILVGPSGSGKTSIGKKLEEKSIPRLVTTTTRSARSNEIDGKDYYFRKPSEMEKDDFVEQTIYNENQYGLTKDEISTKLKKHDRVHVSLDKNGARAVKEKYPKESFIIFVKIKEEEMVKRMKKRGDSKMQIQERLSLAQATKELVPLEEADLVIRNKEIDETVKEIMNHI